MIVPLVSASRIPVSVSVVTWSFENLALSAALLRAVAERGYTQPTTVQARSANYTGLKMRDFQAVQLRIGVAGARIDAARQLLRNDCLEGQEIANRNVIADPERKLRFKRNLAYAVSLCTEAVVHASAADPCRTLKRRLPPLNIALYRPQND